MNHHPSFFTGQRCVSATEPELGLGTIVSVDARFVEVTFKGADCSRKYAAASAPLTRTIFGVGDWIVDLQGNRLQITGVSQELAEGILTYHHGGGSFPESQIAQSCAASTPLKRLLAGSASRSAEFSLRGRLLLAQAEILKSPCRGFAGGRIELLPHQLSIAAEVASRKIVRVILADETGLGKTIEACLILHRLTLLGRVRRCLICVPEPLVHQWFIELMRRFNLMFRLFTQEHFDSCAGDANPFLNDQFGICSLELLAADKTLSDRAEAAGWDLVIVDEAHHLHHDTPEYACVKKLSARSAGLILLTATPEQLGRYDHFLRLQLLDPNRYADYEAYETQTRRFLDVSQFVAASLAGIAGSGDTATADTAVFNVPSKLLPLLPHGQGDAVRAMTLKEIIDRFGTGRVMLRNTRGAISGFPRRVVHICPLDPFPDGNALTGKTHLNANPLKSDPRGAWLAGLLKEAPAEKFLVICTTKENAAELQDAVLSKVKIDIALFHEGMTLLQRDRSAAWFAEEEGARIMISSELGGEGRNFQFCRNLVLFDLPADPEVLEQRIGRIDRIGQGASINIYAPYVRGTPQELLCRWYHEGLDAFNYNIPAAGRVAERMRGELDTLLASGQTPPGRVDSFIKATADLCAELSRQLADGRDFLLQRSSFHPREARELRDAIEKTEHHKLAETVMNELFRHYGICAEEAGAGKWLLNTDYVTDHRFPVPRQERPLITYSRSTALAREDIDFVSIDHPMALGALDLFLSSDCGTSAFAVWDDPHAKQLLLEARYALECLAPDALYVNRFLPPTPLRIVVDHAGKDVTDDIELKDCESKLSDGRADKLLAKQHIVEVVLPKMLALCDNRAQLKSAPLIEEALRSMRALLGEEIWRLRDLQRVNPAISDLEIAACEQERDALENHLKNARVRLDSVRVIWRGKAG